MESINRNFIIESKYQKRINDKVSQCLTCEWKCKITKGKAGHCKTRMNHDGVIFSLVYGCIPSLFCHPIEIKPLYHFFPGSKALTAGTYGCNFDCFWCQNHHISHPSWPILEIISKENAYLSPDKFIELAKENNCQGISFSLNEPTLLFEYSLEVFKLANKNGLYNTYVTNGYMTEEVLRDLVKSGLNAMNIDIKGNFDMVKQNCGADVEKIWRNAKLAKELGVHIEITTLLIDNLNSGEEVIKKIANRILDELGELIPFHISRFFPQYKSNDHNYFKPTSLKLLYKAYDIAQNSGLKYVYVGNITNKKYNKTICPNCSKTLILRNCIINFGITDFNIDDKGNCKFCGYNICVY